MKLVFGEGSCGIAAGARKVRAAVEKLNADNAVGIGITGCIGMCKLEPLVDVFLPGEEKVTYIKMTPEKAVRVVNDHIVNKNIVSEYTIGSAE